VNGVEQMIEAHAQGW